MFNVRTHVRRVLFAAAVAFCALTLHACSNACESLAAQICFCLPDDGTRAACNTEATTNESTFPVSASDAAYCQKLLDTNACDCNQLKTAAGKASCGLSYPTQ